MKRIDDISRAERQAGGIMPPAHPGGRRHGRHAWLTTIFGLPLYAFQGARLRRTIPRLLPPPGPVLGRIDGSEPEIRLLVIGDSSVQAVGVDRQEDGITCRLAGELAERTGRAVRWRAAGFNSATISTLVRYVLPHLEPRDFTHIIVSAGVNDAKNFHSVRRFDRDFGGLIYALRARFPLARLYWCTTLDLRSVPGIPQPIATLMDMRSDLLSERALLLCRERGVVALPRLQKVSADDFSTDRFHAGRQGYAGWARHVADTLLARHLDEDG